ncbi:MAG: hypothetical protein HOV97_06020 [Nonomuraea sp.]|nr:hypothetical protein [Sinomonas sp.]NUS02105.1 hypothetical protein [Nonomuraea sp.]
MEIQGPGMIRVGETRNVRELKRGVQAHVCLGSDAEHGSAVVVVESSSPRVMAALSELKTAIAEEAKHLTAAIHQGQLRWEQGA